jgi:hypothetical protein
MKEFDIGDLIILKFMRFDPGYKSSIEYKYKLVSIDTSLRIIEKLSSFSYHIVLSMGSKIHDIISIIYLRSFKDTVDHIHSLPIEIDGDKEYTIKYIDDERVNSLGDREFLIKWEDYDNLERT